MSTPRPGLSSTGFAKAFVLPAFSIFIVPMVGLAFFLHAESRFNADARESVLKQIREDKSLTPEQRQESLEFFSTQRFSDLMKNEEFAKQIDGTARFHFATFRWMIRLSIISIAVSVAVFALAALCVLASLSSQRMQYLSLAVGWQVLRVYGALQTLVQGVLLVALSYWVTALWFERYYPQIIFLSGLLGIGGFFAVVVAIFKRVDLTFDVEGALLGRAEAGRFYDDLAMVCRKVGTPPPDQVAVGVDDNFFVTELPVRVEGTRVEGRTLFASLSLLKQLSRVEAEGVLAHEMAHFSGDDTFYSKKIAPLLEGYQRYLQALYTGGVGRLVYYYMNCFRALFELSLGQRSRQREFRADRLSAEATSPRVVAAALLRTTAYSKFRNQVQEELFKQERVLESANISEQIAEGFQAYLSRFAAEHDIGELKSSHPFDSHPPLADRMQAVGVPLSYESAKSLLAAPVDDGWYGMIDGAEEMERRQWAEFEAKFREMHAASLPYRFLPETEEERAIVTAVFPPLTIEGKSGNLSLDCQRLHFSDWPAPIEYHEITGCAVENGRLWINYRRDGKKRQKLKLKVFGKRQQEALDIINRYWGRYQSAAAYQQSRCGISLPSMPATRQSTGALDSRDETADL